VAKQVPPKFERQDVRNVPSIERQIRYFTVTQNKENVREMLSEMSLPFSMEQCVTTGFLAIPSVCGKKDAIVSIFSGLSCG